MVSKNTLQVQNKQHAIGREISHIKWCNWSSPWCNKGSRNLISENQVAANFIMLGYLAEVSVWGLVSETDFASCLCWTWRKFELTSRMCVGYVNLSMGNSQANRFRIPVGSFVWNLIIESIRMLQQYIITAPEQVILARAWYAMTAMNTIVEMFHLPLKYRHVDCLSSSGLDQSRWFPHTTNYKSGQSSPHLWQRVS